MLKDGINYVKITAASCEVPQFSMAGYSKQLPFNNFSP